MSKSAFPIVGIGASAGGLDAFHRFCDHMQADCGMAFVQRARPSHHRPRSCGRRSRRHAPAARLFIQKACRDPRRPCCLRGLSAGISDKVRTCAQCSSHR